MKLGMLIPYGYGIVTFWFSFKLSEKKKFPSPLQLRNMLRIFLLRFNNTKYFQFFIRLKYVFPCMSNEEKSHNIPYKKPSAEKETLL